MLTIVSTALTTGPTIGNQVCPATHPNVVSGGFNGVGSGNGQFEVSSFPSAPDTWTVVLAQTDSNGWSIYAICST
jgi:hypothetical protein